MGGRGDGAGSGRGSVVEMMVVTVTGELMVALA